MIWVVDTCLIIDVLDADPRHARTSAACLDAHADHGLALCPLSFVELAPAFLGDEARQCEFLDRIGIDYRAAWQWEDTRCAHRAWHVHISARRARNCPRRPVADALIGAFAQRIGGLLTRNVADFRALYPNLPLTQPAA